MCYNRTQFLIIAFFTWLYYIPSYSQELEKAKTAAKIGLSELPGFSLPLKSAYWLDTINFRPENFSFRIWDKKDLTDRLELNVPMCPVQCKPSWGMFVFRVNAEGKVDSTWYRGNLPATTSDKIIYNIRATEGNWIIKKGTKPNHVAWFVYPFFDIRGRFPKQPDCSKADQELLQTVSDLSNLFYILFYKVDKDSYRGTMLRPTTEDGSIKM
jgi:hypothetical protein